MADDDRMPLILVSTSTFGVFGDEPIDMLKASGFDFKLNDLGRKMTEDEIRDRLRGVCGLIAGSEPLTRSVLEQAEELRVISRVGVGLDSVDLEAAKDLDIQVFTARRAITDAVAELTLGGILALLRSIHAMDANMRRGAWERRGGTLLRGKTVGIVGLGRVGKRVRELLRPFHVRVLACDPSPDREWAEENDVMFVALEELLTASDIVMIHAAAVGADQILGRGELNLMKKGAFLVNTARGSLVDCDSLHESLASNRLAGAYLDVFPEEPYQGRLAELPNVLLTPHAGSYAKEARAQIEVEAVENLLSGLKKLVIK